MADEPIDNWADSSALASGASSDAPSSALASLEKVSAASSPAASPAAPGTPLAPEPPSADAIGQPGAVVPAKPAGEAPEHRIQAAVRNARADVERQYAWVKETVPKDFGPADVKAGVSLIQRLRQDPRTFLSDLSRELGIASATPSEDADPEPDLVSEDGKYKTYSDKTLQQLWERRERKLVESLKSELRPVFDFVGAEQQSRATSQVQEQARGQAADTLTVARELPHFKEHEAAIAEKMQGLIAADPQIVDRVGAVAALYMAYNAVLKETVFPTLSQSSNSKVLTDFQRKATAASGAVHPINGAGTPKKPVLKEGDVGALARHMERMAEAG